MGLEELPELGAKPRRHLLSVCGGGYAGLFAAEFLRRLEERLGKPIGSVFDLIAGTSIGGLLALGFAHGMPAATLSTTLQDLGPKLFGKPGWGLFRPKHDPAVLRATLHRLFGDAKLSSLSGQVLIPAVNLTGGEAIVFRNSRSDPTSDTKIVDAALATTAAPYLLTPHSADERLYADGGLVANSPEALAALDAIHRFRWGAERTTLLVVGSTQTCARLPGHLIGANWGGAEWVKDKRILTATMRAQMSLARQMSIAMLGADRVRVADIELSSREEQLVSLDKTTAEATQILKTLARERFDSFCTESETFVDQLR